MRTRPVGVALALALIATPTLAGENAHEPLAWVAVSSRGPSLVRPDLAAVDVVSEVWVDPPRSVAAVTARRPVVVLPDNPARSVAIGDDVLGGTNSGGGSPKSNPCCPRSLSGIASWYCGHGSRCTVGYPDGLYAAIRRDLLGHRGHQARVCAAPRCVVVTIIDCNCGANANLIDLYSSAFQRLAPLSRGRIQVTLTWVR